MNDLFGFDLGTRFSENWEKEPVLRAKYNGDILQLEKNVVRRDTYDVKLTEILKFSEVEPSVYDADEGSKLMTSYGHHMMRLEECGLERTMSPQEIFAIIINKERKQLNSPELENLVDDIINESNGEFTGCFMQRNGNNLTLYGNVTDIRCNNEGEYWAPNDGSWYSSSTTFDITDLGSGNCGLLTLKYRCPELIEYLFNMPFEELPALFRYGPERMKVELPDCGGLHPMTISFGGRYDITSCHDKAGSRGVR